MNVIIIQSSFLLGSLCNNDGEVQLPKRHFSKKWIRATSNFIVLIPTRSIRQMLANFAVEDCIKAQEKKKKVDVFIHVREKKREIRHFHVLVVQRQQRNVQKSVMHLQSCWFANLLLLFCRSRCRWRRCRRRRCLSSLFFDGNTLSYIRSRHSTTVSSSVNTLQILSELSRVLLDR